MTELQVFIDWAFKALIGGILLVGHSSFKRMTESVEQLNIKIAVLIERTENHSRAIEKHEDRISEIEKKV